MLNSQFQLPSLRMGPDILLPYASLLQFSALAVNLP